MPTYEGSTLRQRLRGPLDIKRLVGKLAPRPARVGEEGADPALDVDPGILSGGAGRRGDPVERLLSIHQILRHRFEQ